jgi:N-acetylmuramoyl-L-alanine amidase
MKKQEKKSSDRRHHGKAGTYLRLVCVALCALMLSFLVGCDSYATDEEMSALRGELDAALWEVESLKGNLSSAEEEIDAMRASDEASVKEIDALKEAESTLRGELDALKNSNVTFEQKIGYLEGKLTAAETEIDSIESGYAAAEQEISSLESENEALRQELEALKNGHAAILQEIESLKAQIEELQNGVLPEPPAERIKIYVDQGHNPTSHHNSGATGNGLYEENLTFTVGRLLAQLLEEDGRFDVRLSRPTAYTVLGEDNDSSLDARVQGAVDFGADYFISLHTNSYSDVAANGLEVHVAEESGASFDLGAALLQGMLDATGLRDRGMKKSPDLRVLKNATMPAVLLEMGFITNAEDAALLSQHPELFARGIYDGILSYFDLQPVDPEEP